MWGEPCVVEAIWKLLKYILVVFKIVEVLGV
jgi:hypothetical protein